MKINFLPITILATAAMVSCTTNEVFDNSSTELIETTPIGVDVYTSTVTRAVTPFTDTTLQRDGFLMGSKQDTLVFLMEKVTYSVDKWGFSNTYYWDTNSHDFYSFNLPYSKIKNNLDPDNTTEIIKYSNNITAKSFGNNDDWDDVESYVTSEALFPYVAVYDKYGDYDFMTAASKSINADTSNGNVPVEFEHQLAQVQVNVYAPDDKFDYLVKGVYISNVYNGYFNAANGSWLFNSNDWTSIPGYNTDRNLCTLNYKLDDGNLPTNKYLYESTDASNYIKAIQESDNTATYNLKNEDLFIIPSGEVTLYLEYIVAEKNSQTALPTYDFTKVDVDDIGNPTSNDTRKKVSLLGGTPLAVTGGIQAGHSYVINVTLTAGPTPVGVNVSVDPFTNINDPFEATM